MNYSDEEYRERKAYDQDADEDYYKIYKEYMRELEEKGKNGRAAGDKKINLNSFSEKKTAPKKRSAEDGRTRRKKAKNKKKLVIILSSVALILGILLYFLWPFLNYNYHKLKGNNEDLGFSDIINEKVVNIALFGIDTRSATGSDQFEGRSDSIMILSINTETKKVKVLSVMRDTIIRIENEGEVFYSKANSAYFYGGPELAIKTLNQNFGLDISNYATVNFFGMVDIIDAVGGIDATITEDELDFKGNGNPNLNGCMEEICSEKGLNLNDYRITSAGTQHLNGVQAVAYARIRHCMSTFGTTDDYGRTDRQRYVMEQLFSKAIKLKKTDYIRLAKALLPCSQTSLTYSDIISLSFNVLLKKPTFEQYRIPQTSWLMPFNYSEYGSCVYYDRDYAKRAVHAIIYDDMTMDQFTEANPVEKNDWFASIFGAPDVVSAPSLPDETTTSSEETPSENTGESQNETSAETPSSDDSGTNSQDDNGIDTPWDQY